MNNEPQAVIYEIKRYIQMSGVIEEHVPIGKDSTPREDIKPRYYVFVTVNITFEGGMQGPTVREPAEILGCKNIYQAFKKAPPIAEKKAEEIKERIRGQMQGPKIITPGIQGNGPLLR